MSLHELTSIPSGFDSTERELSYGAIQGDPHELNEDVGEMAVNIESIEQGRGGMRIERVSVEDESQWPAASEKERQMRAEFREQLELWDQRLQETPDAKPPFFDKQNNTVVSHNGASELLFEHDASIREWGLMMPSARALYYLTHVGNQQLPSGQFVSEQMQLLTLEMVDAVGIRTRKRIAANRVRSIIDDVPSDEDVRCLSLACGAADLMLETTANAGRPAKLTLVDIDDNALAMADEIAADHRLYEGIDYVTLKRNLITTMARGDSLVEEVGEGTQQVVDALGINEYFSLPIARDFLKNAYRCVKPGGSLITANMLDDRPQMRINKIAVGWPKVIPRSTDDMATMLEAAGLPLDQTTITIPEDGIYAVIEIKKPVET